MDDMDPEEGFEEPGEESGLKSAGAEEMLASEDDTIKKVSAGSMAEWKLSVSPKAFPAVLSVSVSSGRDDAPEWEVMLYDGASEVWNSNHASDLVELSSSKTLVLKAECPGGGRYGDSVSIAVTLKASSYEESITFEAVAKQSILILKTQIDQEKSVADSLYAKANLGEKDIYAVLSPQGLRGYVFVEGMNTDRLLEKTKEIKKARKFIEGETSIDDISHYLTPASPVIRIAEGDIVELVNGPFKGEQARVQKVDPVKESVVIELIGAMVPIPVDVKAEWVRVIEKEE